MPEKVVSPYLTQGVIAYIGNKRRLLELIGEALRKSVGAQLSGVQFLDLFAGSGVVSRYARYQGMRVIANDWEPYSQALCSAWLEPTKDDVCRIFGSMEDFRATIQMLNSAEVQEEYLARYYAPASHNIQDADYRKERLFYTRSNALILDGAREKLECLNQELVEKGASTQDRKLHKNLLLAPILYAAATHVNTSGVFKAFHKGFGGYGKDALQRITAPIQLMAPQVLSGNPGTVLGLDANTFVSSYGAKGADVVYLDPPYNQHQYGSNYHLLNSLALWDRIPEPLELGDDGRLVRKAGIRSDWVKTRSDYCSRARAPKVFAQLLDGLDASFILISYSTDGIIPFEELRTICESFGRVRLVANPYVTYRGGRQSARRRDKNVEFILILEKGGRSTPRDRRGVDRAILARRLQLLKGDFYHPKALSEHGDFQGTHWFPRIHGKSIAIETQSQTKLLTLPTPEEIGLVSSRKLIKILEKCRCQSRGDELHVLENIWRNHPGCNWELLKEVPRILRKMAHRKYREEFEMHLELLRGFSTIDPPLYHRMVIQLDAIEEQARQRFSG